MKGSGNEKLDRREFLKKSGLAAAGLGILACSPTASPVAAPTKAPSSNAPAAGAAPADAEATAKLFEAARKEGQVMVYATGTEPEWEEFTNAFMKKYPGVKALAFTGSSNTTRPKILAEMRAGKPVADVNRSILEAAYTLGEEKALDTYISPEHKNFDKKHYDPQGLWTVLAYYVCVPEYNTKAFTKAQAPKGYADMLKPEYKGKLGLEAAAVPWFSRMLKIMGRDKGLEYMRKLGEQKPRLVSGHANLSKLVASGEIPLAVYNFHNILTRDKADGAPVDWVDPVEVTPSYDSMLLMIKNAPHPNAARLMADYMLSAEGAQHLINWGYIPTRNGANLASGELLDISKVDVLINNDISVAKDSAADEKLFQEIFGKA